MFVGYGILPSVYTSSWRHVDYGTPSVISLSSRRYSIYGTQLSFVSLLHPWRHVVRGILSLNFRELRRFTSVNSAFLQLLWTLRPSTFVNLVLHSSASCRRDPTSFRAAPSFIRVTVRPCSCIPAAYVSMFLQWRYSNRCLCRYCVASSPCREVLWLSPTTTNSEYTNSEDTNCSLKTATTTTTATLLLGYRIIVGLAYEVLFIYSTA